MATICVGIKWHDINDKDITNPSKYTILNENWSVGNMTDIPNMGLAEDVEIFVKRNSNQYPSEDSRLVIITSAYGPTDKQDSEFPLYRVWERSYTVRQRSKEDKKSSVDACCANANSLAYPTEKRAQYDDIYSVALRKKTDGIELTAIELDIMNKKEIYANAMVSNIAVANAKKDAIDNDIPVDLDSDWIDTDPTVNA